MSFGEIWEWMNTQEAFYVYILVIILLFWFHWWLKRRKVKLLLSYEKFRNAKLFRDEITTPMAISPEGYLGVVPSPFSPPLIMEIKSAIGYEIFFDGHSVEKLEKAGKNELVFIDIGKKIEERLKTQTKKITAAFSTKNGYTLTVVIYNSSRRLTSAMRDSSRNTIKEFFQTLEETERAVKKKSPKETAVSE